MPGTGRRARGRPGTTLLGALAFMLVALLPASHAGVGTPASTAQAVSRASARDGFDLVTWEVGAILQGASRRMGTNPTLAAMGEAEQRELVKQHAAAAADAGRLHGELAALGTGIYRDGQDRQDGTGAGLTTERPGITGRGGRGLSAESAERLHVEDLQAARREELRGRLGEAERRVEQLAPLATEVIARQTGAYLATQGLGGPPLRVEAQLAFPPLRLTVNPPVFFRFERLPLLLVVAPRDRIEVLESVFMRAGLTGEEMAQIEEQVDQHGASSLILPIGGFAAYPSMIPHSGAVRDTLQTVAHEWVHHYLAMHPLGQRYFAGYALRSINETVADIAGEEIGEAVFRQHYATNTSPEDGSPDATRRDRPALSFGQAMGEIRRTVEAMLRQGEVGAAEEYMAERKTWLATQGYYLRKLNTAYLTFFGAYAGSGNSYEPGLRRLRERSGSLAEFLRRAGTISDVRDFEALARE